MNVLLEHLTNLTPAQRRDLAEKARTSAASLRLAAHGYKTKGLLNLSPDFAARVEEASDGALSRTQLSDLCASCPHARK